MSELDADLAALDERIGMADPEAETPSEEVPEVVPEAPAEETAERPRDEKGRFAALETVDDPDIQSFLEKYQGDPIKALKAATEAQKLIGSQGEELGWRRQAMEEGQPVEEEEESFTFDQGSIDWFDEQIDTNPQDAALYALKNDKTGNLYNRAMDAWYEMPGQARRAAAFERMLDGQRVEQLIEAKTKPLVAQSEAQTLEQAWVQMRQTIPDLDSHGPAILEEARESPEIFRGAQTLEEKAKAIHKLYRLVRGSQADSLQTATAENTAAETEQAREAKLSGGVATQSQTAVPESPDIWETDPELAAFDQVINRHYED